MFANGQNILHQDSMADALPNHTLDDQVLLLQTDFQFQQAVAMRPMIKTPDNQCSAYLDLVRDTVTGVVLKTATVIPILNHRPQLQPFDLSRRTAGTDWCDGCFSMAGTLRVDNVRMLVQDVVMKNIPGDFLEAGAWRGGCSIMARLTQTCMEPGNQRMVHVCDSFEGLPGASTPLDSDKWSQSDYLRVSVDQVADNFRAMAALDNGVRFHKGFFQHSLPPLRLQFQKEGRKIAVLRGDGDMLESYWDILYNMYEFVPIGGYFICDDCPAIPEAMRGINEFRQKHGIQEPLHTVVGSAFGMYWQKEKDVAVQYSDYVAWNNTRVR